MRLIYKGNTGFDVSNINWSDVSSWDLLKGITNLDLSKLDLSKLGNWGDLTDDNNNLWSTTSGNKTGRNNKSVGDLHPSNEIISIDNSSYSLDYNDLVTSVNNISKAYLKSASGLDSLYLQDMNKAYENYDTGDKGNESFDEWYNNNLATLYLYRHKWAHQNTAVSNEEAEDYNRRWKLLFGTSWEAIGGDDNWSKKYGTTTAARFLPIIEKNSTIDLQNENLSNYYTGLNGFLYTKNEETSEESDDSAEETSEESDDSAEETSEESDDSAEETSEESDDSAEESTDDKLNPDKPILGKHFNWGNVFGAIKSFTPEALKIGELLNTLNANRKSAKTLLRGNKPYLQQPFLIQSPVFGDFAAMRALYGLAADIRRQASNNATSDASINLAGRLDAETKAAQLEEKGREADNAQIQKTLEQAVKNANYSNQLRNETANANAKALNETRAKAAEIKSSRIVADKDAISKFITDHTTALETEKKELKEREKAIALANEDNAYQLALSVLNASYNKAHPGSTTYDKTLDLEYNEQVLKLRHINENNKYLIELGRYNGQNLDPVASYQDFVSNISTYKWPVATERDGGYIPKLASGGYAQFFTTYQPAPKQQETRTASSSSSSKKDDGKVTERDIMQYISRINGLDSDMQQMLQMWQGLSEYAALTGVSTMDLATQYGMIISYGNAIRNNKAEFDKAKEEAVKAGALNEEAIAVDGSLFVLTPDAQIHRVTPQLYVLLKNSNPEIQVLTNSLLLLIRRKDSSYANNNTLLGVVENAIGADEVNKMIKDRFSKIGTNSMTQEEYIPSPVLAGAEYIEQEQERVKNGERSAFIESFNDIRTGPLNGWYKRRMTTEGPNELEVLAVAQYIWTTLPNNAKTKLIIETPNGSQDEAFLLIIQNILGQTNKKQSITYLFTAAPTEKAGKSSGGKSGTGSTADDEDFTETQMGRFLRGICAHGQFTFNSGNSIFTVANVHIGTLFNIKGSPYEKYTKVDTVFTGQLNGGIVNTHAASIAGKICEYTNDTVISGNGMYMFDYPSSITDDGKIVPNLDPSIQLKVKEARLEISSKNINLNDLEDVKNHYEEINEIYKKHGLETAYDENGILTSGWHRFICLNVYTTERTLKGINNSTNWDQLPLVKKVTGLNKDKVNEINETKDNVYETVLWLPILKDVYVNSLEKVKRSAGDYTERKRQEPDIVNGMRPVEDSDLDL